MTVFDVPFAPSSPAAPVSPVRPVAPVFPSLPSLPPVDMQPAARRTASASAGRATRVHVIVFRLFVMIVLQKVPRGDWRRAAERGRPIKDGTVDRGGGGARWGGTLLRRTSADDTPTPLRVRSSGNAARSGSDDDRPRLGAWRRRGPARGPDARAATRRGLPRQVDDRGRRRRRRHGRRIADVAREPSRR